MEGTSEDCSDRIDVLMPTAMNVIAGLLVADAETFCQEEIGVC